MRKMVRETANLENIAISIAKKRYIYKFVKRLFDITFSFIGLILISPTFIICFIISFLSTSSWPIFLDKRIGRGGKKVNIFKFRTMYIDAETNANKYLNEAQMKEWKKERKVTNDPRITKFGRFLRKTSLDELPQLINVLIGNMSFVGPRPITESEIKDNFNELETKALLSSRPGLTGYWQVVGRSDDTWTSGERKNLTLLDIEHSSLLFDAKVLLLTIPSVIKFASSEKSSNR